MTHSYGGLTAYRQFILYRKTWDATKGKYIKQPCNIGGGLHDAHDPKEWLSYDEARTAADLLGDGYDVGFVFTENDPLFFLDIDNCLVDGQWSPLSLQLCSMFPGAYVEVSVGGTGLHIVGTLTDKIEHACRNTPFHLEFYTELRFMALGRPETSRGNVSTVCNEAVRSLVTQYFNPTNNVSGTQAMRDSAWTTEHDPLSRPIMNDDVLVAKAMKSTSATGVFGGAKKATFAELWNAADSLGDYFPADNDTDTFNHSAADSALATHLMFWTGGNCERTATLMKKSALYRDKFERDDYMQRTILGGKAIHASGNGGYYSMTDEIIEVVQPGKDAIDLADDIRQKMENFVVSLCKGTYLADKPVQLTVDATAIDQIITRTFWSGTKSKLFVLTDDNVLNMYVEKDMLRIVEKYFGSIVDNAEVEHYANELDAAGHTGKDAEKITKQITAIPYNTLTDYLKMKNQRDKLRSKVDMFAKRPRMEWFNDSVTNVYIWKRLPDLGAPDQEIINDYLNHFPMFDQLVQQIVAARFASDRKNCFTWLRADSDWGKGIFTSALRDLGLLVELSVAETEKAFEGAPMAKDATLFTHAFIVCFNEFKMVKSELKQIENELPISPKNQLMQTVDIYHKLFTSAESVDSLVGESGVEDQFANRFSYIDGKGAINDRPMFMSAGKFRYFNAVKQHVANRINQLVDHYVTLGEDESRIEADKFVDAFHQRYGISQTFERISANIPTIIQSFKEWVIKRHSAAMPGTETCLYKDADFYYLTTPSKIYSDWLDDTASRSEKITLSKKKNEIIKALGQDDRPRFNGRQIRAVKFTL